MKRTAFSLLLLALLCPLMTGCSSSPASRFYLLAPRGPSGSSEDLPSESIAIRVWPTELPRYLDRPQIVTRDGESRIELAEFDRWAEPLDSNFLRTLTMNLSRRFPGDLHSTFFLDRNLPADYQVRVSVLVFDVTSEGEEQTARLDARYTILDGSGEQWLSSKIARLTKPVTGDDFDARVAALSDLLATLSDEIAQAIAGHATEKK